MGTLTYPGFGLDQIHLKISDADLVKLIKRIETDGGAWIISGDPDTDEPFELTRISANTYLTAQFDRVPDEDVIIGLNVFEPFKDDE